MLDEQPHQPLRVKDELVAAGLPVPANGGPGWVSEGRPRPPARPGEWDGPHLMMVCMPRTCGVLLRTLSVRGRGWHWCAEASAALGTQSDWGLKKGHLPAEPHPPAADYRGQSWWARWRPPSQWLIWREGPIPTCPPP